MSARTCTRLARGMLRKDDLLEITAQTGELDDSFFESATGMGVLFANELQSFVDYRTVAEQDCVDADIVTNGIRGAF